MPTIKPEVLVSASSEILLALRVLSDAARVVAEHLVDADLCGVASSRCRRFDVRVSQAAFSGSLGAMLTALPCPIRLVPTRPK
jgi:LDH2 family malate/lactate/ureidoglycolate dehydrogenase